MGELLKLHPVKDQEKLHRVAELVNTSITPPFMLDCLHALQGPAPTGTVELTRTPIVTKLMKEAGVPAGCMTMHFQESDTFGITLGKERPKVLFDAHADQISYLVPMHTNATTFDVMPNCAHRVEKGYGPFPAKVIRYIAKHKKYEEVSTGMLGTSDRNTPYYEAGTKPKRGFSPGIDRIVFTYDFTYDEMSSVFTGNIDNAAGIAALVGAARALEQIRSLYGLSWEDFRVAFVMPDGEEGLPGESDYFARGVRQMLHGIPQNQLPENVVIVDGHDANKLAHTAAYAASVSGGKGAIVPPPLYAQADRFFRNLRKFGVSSTPTEHAGVLSRSDDVAYLEFTNNILPFGYWERNPHFNHEHPTADLQSIINCAKGVAWASASAVL